MATPARGTQGTPMVLEISEARRKRAAARRKAENGRWVALAGDVSVRQMSDDELARYFDLASVSLRPPQFSW
jgi:hypothetical protein